MAREWTAQLPAAAGHWAYKPASGETGPRVAMVQQDGMSDHAIWLECPVRVAQPAELEGLLWLDLEDRQAEGRMMRELPKERRNLAIAVHELAQAILSEARKPHSAMETDLMGWAAKWRAP